MARKKIVFVIVEGPSDEDALGAILSRIYDSSSLYVHITHGDITTRFSGKPNENIVTMIATEIRGYSESNHYGKSDFKEIIHIVDMDGAYIPNDNVVEDASAIKPFYSLTEIRTSNKQGIENRNERKGDNINRLCGCKKIWGSIPYRVFYMSCNLDHVLYDKMNSSDEQKEADSLKFAKAYKDKLPEFLDYISKSDFSVVNGYRESWDFIKQYLHSLERYTNLGLCFEEKNTPPSVWSELHAKLKKGYDDIEAGNVQNAAEVFAKFRENH